MFKILVFSIFCMIAKAVEYEHGGGGDKGHHVDYYAEPHYSFAYEVKDAHTGDHKSHKEERKGDHTYGVYFLVEPDGSKRTVEYSVKGKSGFNAKVHREHTKHPQSYKSGHQSGGHGYQFGDQGHGAGGHEFQFIGQGHQFGGHGYQFGGQGHQSGGQEYQQLSAGYHGGEATSHSSYQTHGGQSQQVHHSQPSNNPSSHGSFSAKQGNGYHFARSSHQPQPSYHFQPGYHQGSGKATSRFSLSTHGAKLSSSTYHATPSKHHY